MNASLLLQDPMGNTLEALIVELPKGDPTPRILLDSNSKRAYYLCGEADGCYVYHAQAYTVIRGTEIMQADSAGMIVSTDELKVL